MKKTNDTIVCLHYSQIHSAARVVVILTHLDRKKRGDGGKEEEEKEEEEKKRSIMSSRSEFIKSESFQAHYSLPCHLFSFLK